MTKGETNNKLVVKKKGRGLHIITAYILLLFLAVGVPMGGRVFWPYLLSLGHIKDVTLGINLFLIFGLNFSIHGIYFALYSLKLPSFESYKINPEPWPWDQDQAKWKKTRNLALYYTFQNLLIVNLGISILDYLNP